MGDFGDEQQRPAKRIRLDPSDDACQGPPPTSQPQHVNGHSVPPITNGHVASWMPTHPVHDPWNLPDVSVGPDSLPTDLRDSMPSLVPDPTMLMSRPMENGIAPWPSHFDGAFHHVRLAAVLPSQLQNAADPRENIASQPQFQSQSQPQQQQRLPPQPYLYPQTQAQAQPQVERRHPSLIRSALPSELPHPKQQRRRKSRAACSLISPFIDCIDSFGNSFTLNQYNRPSDGKVNGYIKFSWPREKSKQQHVVNITDVSNQSRITDITDLESELESNASAGVEQNVQSIPGSDNMAINPDSAPPSTSPIYAGGSHYSTSSSVVFPKIGVFSQSFTQAHMPFENSVMTGNPRFVPPHFGYEAKMDAMDRKLWKFYLMNWCPGRSVLKGTNLWLTDFPRMHDSSGILSAIQSLAGIYIHDYMPHEAIRRRVNERFAVAEARLSFLLRDPAMLSPREQSELVTLSSILSMQDIVLTERRLKKPYNPRWLLGFKLGEQVLQATDPGNRFYKPCNVQIDALRASQAIIVSRAVILAQPMMPLAPVANFDAIHEASRFGFLLSGPESDLFAIHGGCGFSKRLLHIFSQVSFCATRMLQDPETKVVPLTANMLYRDLSNMRQWSEEFSSWEEARSKPPAIEWIRHMSEDFIVCSAADMTHVTAEAWRLAGMVYLQCRLFRLPRNHCDVMANLGDLAKSISIMPTSGSVFTAQAPLLPVFLLGLLATAEEHKKIAHDWFQQVIHTPVRSSVPPLYEALQRIQAWMTTEMSVPAPNMKVRSMISERQPWWERMVSKVQEREKEVLCLT